MAGPVGARSVGARTELIGCKVDKWVDKWVWDFMKVGERWKLVFEVMEFSNDGVFGLEDDEELGIYVFGMIAGNYYMSTRAFKVLHVVTLVVRESMPSPILAGNNVDVNVGTTKVAHFGGLNLANDEVNNNTTSLFKALQDEEPALVDSVFNVMNATMDCPASPDTIVGVTSDTCIAGEKDVESAGPDVPSNLIETTGLNGCCLNNGEDNSGPSVLTSFMYTLFADELVGQNMDDVHSSNNVADYSSPGVLTSVVDTLLDEDLVGPDLVDVNSLTSDVSASPNVVTAGMNFEKHTNETVLKPNDAIPSTDTPIVHRLENTLYGYFIGKRIAFPVVEYYVRDNWDKYRLTRLMMNAKGFSKKGLEDVLDSGP
ncbi:hypothetical protein Tco_0624200 [Tanacetum coccineum]|uniref:Uncharacterized protein n=1 Tax=Tanacetum coccineum TaxID=301880 RepID=A0ABQ4WDA0_9ASTR